MRGIKRVRLIMSLVLFMICMAVPVVMPQNAVITEAAKVRISSKSVTLKVGSSKKLKVKGTKKKVKWSSSNKKIAIVNSKGKVTAKAEGKCTVTAKVSGKKLKCSIVVPKAEKKKGTLTLSKKEVTVTEGDYEEVYAYYNGKKVDGYEVDWTSTDESIAWSVSGNIWAEKAGEATITATYKGASAKLAVKVTALPNSGGSSSSGGNDSTNTEEPSSGGATDTSEVKDINYLRNYIIKYGYVTKSGHKAIGSSYAGRSFSITYMTDKNALAFILVSDSDALEMDVSLNSSDYGSAKYIFISSSGSFSASSNVPMSSYYDGMNLHFTLDDKSDSYILEEDIQEICNVSLQAGFTAWNILLSSEVGMTMKDVGFVSYK